MNYSAEEAVCQGCEKAAERLLFLAFFANPLSSRRQHARKDFLITHSPYANRRDPGGARSMDLAKRNIMGM